MLIMVLESVPRRLRGELTHWMVEVKAGVFVGNVNAMVRDRLWEKCCGERNGGAALQAWNTNTEQGFVMRLAGDPGYCLRDWEGVQLVEEVGDFLTAVQKRRIGVEGG